MPCNFLFIDGHSVNVDISRNMLGFKDTQSSIKSNSFSTDSATSDHNSLSSIDFHVQIIKYIVLKNDVEVLPLNGEKSIVWKFHDFQCFMLFMMFDNLIDGGYSNELFIH